MGYKIGVIGPINLDLIIRGNAPNIISELKEWADLSEVYCITAGAAGNVAQNLKKLGNEIHLVSCVADDNFGMIVLNSLQKIGINTDFVEVEVGKEGGIAIYILLFGDNKRPATFKIPTHHGWPHELKINMKNYLLDADLVHSSGYLHFSNLWNKNFLELFKDAKKLGHLTSMDPQFPLEPIDQPWIKILRPLIPFIDVLMVDENEAINITGLNALEDAGDMLINEGFEVIAIKLGEKGVMVMNKNERVKIPAIQPKFIIDSIGAGDAFDAGFLQGFLEGKDIEIAGKMGIKAASLSLEGIDSTDKFPTRDLLEI
ncbi:MAG: carbohydrate kinase family protein [Promethearchaeota archaeon]|nr:MAG: carbohydrate kinase family protein [Candidatus Lokiarchaeota archaeon]